MRTRLGFDPWADAVDQRVGGSAWPRRRCRQLCRQSITRDGHRVRKPASSLPRRGGRAVECGGLENRPSPIGNRC